MIGIGGRACDFTLPHRRRRNGVGGSINRRRETNSSLPQLTLGEISHKSVLQIHTIHTAEHPNIGLTAAFLNGCR